MKNLTATLPNGSTAASSATSSGIGHEIERLGPWFHNLHLPGGIQTAPDHSLGDFPRFKWELIAPHLPERLEGWTALDIGCNAGFYTFQLARRGASVLGMDHDDRYLDQARWAADRMGLADRVRFRKADVYDLGRDDRKFDLVLFMGVLYHLRYPLLGLDCVARKVGRMMVFQSLTMPGEEVLENTGGFGLAERDVMRTPGWPMMGFVEHEMEGDPTNWWAPNRSCVEAMLRSTGLRVTERPEREVFLCEPAEEGSFWCGDQLRAALGLAGASEEE